MAVRNRFRAGYEPNNDYYTPAEVFEKLDLEFDLDVCAPEIKPDWIKAKRHFWIELDGLAQEWEGRVWMNPPYSAANPWHEKFLAHRNGVALVQVSRNKSFRKLWDEADAVLLMPHNFKFVRPDGSLKEIFMPVALIAMGQDNVMALHKTNYGKVR
jgi:hypothetical protein